MKRTLMTHISPYEETTKLKISVVGAGAVGMATCFAIACEKICGIIALVDRTADRVKGEALDLQEAKIFTNCSVIADTDFKITKGSKLCIITAGLPQKQGETRLDMVEKNANIIKSIIPKLMEHNENPVILVVSNPVDVMSYVAWKVSGLPQNQVLGSGTTLDSARFRFYISERLGVNPSSVHAFIVGEHGDSSVPIWSGVTVGGVRLADLESRIGTDMDPENWNQIHTEVVQSAYKVIKLKGYTCWAVGLCVARIAQAILRNSREIFSVSTLIEGCKNEEHKEVYMSLPCVLGENGVVSIIRETMTEAEKEKLHSSASTLLDMQSKVNL